MKVSYNWLKEYVNIDLTAERACEILTDTGLEVEGLHKVEGVKGGLKGVFVGEVLTKGKHPDADRLNVASVSVNTDMEPLQIVCGAENLEVGQKVIVATVGCTLYPIPEEPFKIKKSKIRGVESFGMICAEDELGLGTSHDGILVLDSSVPVGMQAASYFELEDDYEIEIGLTPNRSDAMGHVGVARDLVAYLNVHENANLSLNIPSVESFKVASNDLKIAVSVENEEFCPRYMGTSIKGVKVEASPAWLQKRLRAVGLSPINNVVDVTNFVMHELGTPLHAFDADKLNGKLVVKTATENEKFTTLDDVERELGSDNLMITNGSENLCIAGVLGGINSGISEESTNVFLESAYFNAVSVRKTAKMHALNTDASFRFERGVDPNMTDYALKRAALLIQKVAGGSIAMDVVDTNPQPVADWTVEFNYDRCNRLIGHNISKEMVNAILNNLDIEIVAENGQDVTLKIPTYRVDVTREADVIEEVLRVYGFNNVPLPEKLNSSISYFKKPDVEKVQTVISEMLVGLGCIETMNNSLTKSDYSKKLGGETVKPERNVEMLNPLSQDLDVMRQSLVFNALEMVAHNQNRQNADLKLYEFGKTYHQFESGYSENKRLIIVLSGNREQESWNSSKNKSSYYSIKGTALTVFKRLGLDGMLKEKALKNSLLQDGVQLFVLKNKVGEIGWASPKMKKYFGIKNDVFIADLDWDGIIDSLKFSKVKYSELPKTFAVRRDFSLLLDTKVAFSEIEEIAKSSDKKILKEVGLFDVYEGKNLQEGKKSYAVSFKFQDAEKTLKDQQVDAVMDKIRGQLESKLGAELR
ncbi:MAG TPA: phenylalanine--tRNA ligase subunit beta [Crocinitomicaceae bacterium]|nr:phenylalanine--tRNA ligase subunit beta [Crocinitomicaceae bacterium]